MSPRKSRRNRVPTLCKHYLLSAKTYISHLSLNFKKIPTLFYTLSSLSTARTNNPNFPIKLIIRMIAQHLSFNPPEATLVSIVTRLYYVYIRKAGDAASFADLFTAGTRKRFHQLNFTLLLRSYNSGVYMLQKKDSSRGDACIFLCRSEFILLLLQ